MESQMTKVAVIIPVFNTGNYLQQCVESVLNQTYRNIQIILVDDGSTDGTGAMCDEIAKLDPRIEVIHKENEGLGLTRNKGLEFARGEYVTFLDSDDWLSENHIANLLYGIRKENADMVIGSHTKYSDSGKITQLKGSLPFYGYFEGEQVINKVLPEIVAASPQSQKDMGIPMSVCFNLYRMDLIEMLDIRFPSERYCVSEDFFFNYKYIRNCKKINIVEEYGYFYRNTPMSISHAFAPVQIQRVANFYTEIQKLVFSELVSDDLRMRVYRCSLSKVRSMLKRLSASSDSAVQKIGYIREIVRSEPVRDMLSKVDCSQYRLSLRIFTLSMRCRCSLLVYCLLRLHG